MEKRVQDRMCIYYYLKVFNAENHDLLGHLVDFNTKGIRIVSTNQYESGQEFRVSLKLPETVMGLTDIEFNVVCRHSTKSLNPTLFESGFLIATLPSDLYPVFNELSRRFAMGKN